MSDSDRLRAHANELRVLSQTISLHDDRAFFAKLADDYDRRADRLEGGQTQQIGTQPPPPPPPSDPAQPAQQQQQVQPKEEE